MSKCSDEYRLVRANRGSVVDRASRRISVANTTARWLSSVAPGTDDAMKAAAFDAAKAAAIKEGEAENAG
jgi:hypothetical protein